MESFWKQDADAGQWKRIVKSGLCPEIADKGTYVAQLRQNYSDLCEVLPSLGRLKINGDFVRGLHGRLFEGVHPWAGGWSKVQTVVSGYPGAPIQRIEREFEMLEVQTTELSQGVLGFGEDFFRLAAFTHARDDLGPLCRCLVRSLGMTAGIGRVPPPWRVASFQELGGRDLAAELEAAKSSPFKM